MIKTFNESNGKMTLDDLAKKVAECFNNEIIENNCSDFEDLKFMMQMTSSDIKEDIVWDLYDFTKGTGFKVFDSGNILTPDGENVSYRKFRTMVFKYIKNNPNFDDDEDELTESKIRTLEDNEKDWRGNEGYGADYVDIGLPVIGGTIEDTGERCKMVKNGYWTGAGGKHISSYVRVDKFDWKQYSMDRGHHFWIETDDTPNY